jgi:hypothetical protein
MNLRRFLPWLKPTRTTVVGHVPVDAGCLLLIDPGYLRDVLFPGNAQVEEWYERAVVSRIDHIADEHWTVTAPDSAAKSDKFAVGHLVISGAGDGHYPVDVTYANDGTVTQVRVRFR